VEGNDDECSEERGVVGCRGGCCRAPDDRGQPGRVRRRRRRRPRARVWHRTVGWSSVLRGAGNGRPAESDRRHERP